MWDNLAVEFGSKLWLSFQIPRCVTGLVQPFSTAKAVRGNRLHVVAHR